MNEQVTICENILETIEEAVISINKNWEFTFINQRCICLLKDFDIHPKLAGKKIWDSAPYFKNSVFESTFIDVMQNPKTQTFEIQTVNNKNWLDVSVIPNKDGIIIVAKDITEKKQKELKLKITEELFSKAFDLSPMALSVFKIQNNTFIDVNKCFLDLFDLKYEEVIGENPKKLGFMKGIQKTESDIDHEKNQFCSTFNKKSGELIHVVCSLHNFRINNQPHMLMSIQDITEIKHEKDNINQLNVILEKKVHQKTNELYKALKREKDINDLKSRFISMASHEFKTPLASLLLSACILEKYTKPKANSNLAKHFNRIKSSVNNLTVILNNFLSLDKIEKGMDDKTYQAFNLKHLIESVKDEMKAHLKKGQKIKIEYSGDEEITQDNKKLYNTLLNLISNASKYSMEEKVIEIIVKIEKNKGLITVKDYGIGIPQHEQQNIFTMFFRAKNVEYIQGTGLGLTIIKRYMELIGGCIYFKSTENVGSQFTLEFPIQPSSWLLF